MSLTALWPKCQRLCFLLPNYLDCFSGRIYHVILTIFARHKMDNASSSKNARISLGFKHVWWILLFVFSIWYPCSNNLHQADQRKIIVKERCLHTHAHTHTIVAFSRFVIVCACTMCVCAFGHIMCCYSFIWWSITNSAHSMYSLGYLTTLSYKMNTSNAIHIHFVCEPDWIFVVRIVCWWTLRRASASSS